MSFDKTYLIKNFKDFVSHMGTTLKCFICQEGPATEIDGRMTCYTCAEDLDVTKLYGEPELKFKCPASACDAVGLSTREFWVGTCCDDASRWKINTDNDAATGSNGADMLKVLQKYFCETRKTKITAEKAREEFSDSLLISRSKVANLMTVATKAEKAAKIARKAADDAQRKHDAIRVKYESSRKRERSAEDDYERTRKRFRFLTYEYDDVYELSDFNQGKTP